jgi:uncharacterized surface protein with fasciclin (FAS1) repeats
MNKNYFIFLIEYKMTSIGPYTDKTNLSFMFDKVDLRGPLPQKTDIPNSLSWIISMTPNFSKFRHILRLSKLDNMFCDQQSSYTVFIPTDESLSNIPDNVFLNMDLLTARSIIQASTLKNRITSDVLKDSPTSFYMTLNAFTRLFITNVNNQTSIDNDIDIIHSDIMANNGIIHATNGLIQARTF